MSTVVLFVLAIVGLGFAIAAFVVGLKALRLSKTVVPGEARPQTYMIQAEPPNGKIQSIGLPARDQNATRPREKQA